MKNRPLGVMNCCRVRGTPCTEIIKTVRIGRCPGRRLFCSLSMQCSLRYMHMPSHYWSSCNRWTTETNHNHCRCPRRQCLPRPPHAPENHPRGRPAQLPLPAPPASAAIVPSVHLVRAFILANACVAPKIACIAAHNIGHPAIGAPPIRTTNIITHERRRRSHIAEFQSALAV